MKLLSFIKAARGREFVLFVLSIEDCFDPRANTTRTLQTEKVKALKKDFINKYVE